MDQDPVELSRERAASSEPCSTRPNPFDDNETFSRKRQRTSRGGSRSRSVDTTGPSIITPDSMDLQEEAEAGPAPAPAPAPPHTPPHNGPPPPPPEPNSSRVTINLRTDRAAPLDSIPSSPPSPSPATPSKMINGEGDTNTRKSVESGSDELSTIPAIETPSSSPSAMDSPEIEVVTINDEDDFAIQSPPVATILNDDNYFSDTVEDFPYREGNESLVQVARKVARFLQWDAIENDECFSRLRDWISLYLTTTEDFPDSWYESYVKHRDFWAMFPDLIWALSWRRYEKLACSVVEAVNDDSRFFASFLKRSNANGTYRTLADFFCQFARLTARFVRMDSRTLMIHAQKSENDTTDPDLISAYYLKTYNHLLRKEETHIGKNLETYYEWNWDDEVTAMYNSFQAQGGSLQALLKLNEGYLRLVSRYPKLVDNLSEPCQLVSHHLTQAVRLIFYEVDLNRQRHVENARQQIAPSYAFFEVMSAGLLSIIEKQITSLTPDSAVPMINSLTYILREVIVADCGETRTRVAEMGRNHPDIHPRFIPPLISSEWRFSILQKLITSTQMQLRVVGVTTMCADLLRMYTENKMTNVPKNPYLLFFANFIIRNKIIEYLVGIGSHPEIINESSNILGFLIVTKTYNDSQASATWQTATTTQDPRVVEAILKMLKRCFNLQDYTSLLFLCNKVNTLPIDAFFTTAMREFCDALFQDLIGKSTAERVRSIDAPPYDICVRLIRESSVITPEDQNGYAEIQNFASDRFRDLLLYGPSSETRDEIYVACITDLSARAATSPGSICVINALLRQDKDGAEIRKLTTEYNLTSLVIQELESTIAENHNILDPSTRDAQTGAARRELLRTIIVREPGTITDTLGTKLWNLLVGSASKNVAERNISWQTLNTARAESSFSNVFLDTCFQVHLPTLAPEFFTMGTLEFVKVGIFRWLQESRPNFVQDDRTFESLALDQLWRMILEAPPKNVDAAAINLLVETYVDSQLILSIPRAKARNIHSALVERCLKQLSSAASKLKHFNREGTSDDTEDLMILDSHEIEFQNQEVIFARSLAVLREFLRAYQSKPQFAPPKLRPAPPVPAHMEGEPLTLKYQSFDGDKQTEVKNLVLGKLNTAATLFASLEKATGFSNYRVYCGGKRFDPDEIEVSKSLEDLNLSGLVLVQRRGDTDGSLVLPAGGKTSLEFEIMKSFDDLWGYLGMHEKVAHEIYTFLVKFPAYDRLQRDFDSDDVPYSTIFPQQQPFKSSYAIHALREYISLKTQKGDISDTVLTRATSLVIEAISDRDVVQSCQSEELRDSLSLQLVNVLIELLRDVRPSTSLVSHLNEKLLSRLLEMLYHAKSVATSRDALSLTARSFDAILESCLHNPDLWTSFTSHMNENSLLGDLLLEDSRINLRKSISKQILTKCNSEQSPTQGPGTDFTAVFWPLISRLIVEAAQPRNRHQCNEVFQLYLALFESVGRSIDALALEKYLMEWANLLLQYNSAQRVDYPEGIDPIAQGLANLCLCAINFAKHGRERLTACSSIGAKLFRKHLFPALSADSHNMIAPRFPLLHVNTRFSICEIILFLVQDNEVQYRKVLDLLLDLVPYNHGDHGPYVYDVPYMFDRSRAIRSSTGYVGLRNLSNTCYLNSLFTQLFMNTPFREFMLNVNASSVNSPQKLLYETKRLFSYMQNTLKRFVDPADLALSIRTYDDSNIDVSIQMDVDEFYNLLFDRWEGQLRTDEERKQFRSFYSGKLVQQVKSKECDHISERTELFSAIQCDIKGKNGLEQSLRAYVEGEIMEGDNKYKCSTCDLHVNAVKRTCLKEVPDSLIFHLKRFDFNLRTMARSKINEHFSFPSKIDMRPYKFEHIIKETDASPEDMFELVGILVHSGTAESGHYFSYIRERPSSSDQPPWVEFNDDLVSPWDPNTMENKCFGGTDNVSGNYPLEKNYSAYMLFYQRSTVVADQNRELMLSGECSPLRLPLESTRVFNHLTMENELLIRKYCLYDPSQAPFVTKMLANVKNINQGPCSDSHELEKRALLVALNHLDQVVSRAKDTSDFVSSMLPIKQLCHSCAECSRDFLEWLCECPDALRNLILRNSEGLVRVEIWHNIISALEKVKKDASYAYGFDFDDTCDQPQLIHRIVETLAKLWDQFHTSCRAWPEYFGLLADISKLGDEEAAILVDSGFLLKTLDVISADPALDILPQYQRMLNIISKRTATRPVSFGPVIELLWRLLEHCDLSATQTVRGNESRWEFAQRNLPLPLVEAESKLLSQHWVRGSSHILTEKLLLLNQNRSATTNILINLLHSSAGLDNNIFQAICLGLRKMAPTTLCGQFLKAAITYCNHSEWPEAIHKMVGYVSKIASKVENQSEGKDFAQFFFQDLLGLSSTALNLPKEDIIKICLDNAPVWAPALLGNWDSGVRQTTEAFISQHILNRDSQVDSESPKIVPEDIAEIARTLAHQCLVHLDASYVNPRVQAVKTNLENILRVIEACVQFYDEDDRKEFIDGKDILLYKLQKITVEQEMEDEVSDWDGSEEDYGSSEPMESITELGGTVNDDLDMDSHV